MCIVLLCLKAYSSDSTFMYPNSSFIYRTCHFFKHFGNPYNIATENDNELHVDILTQILAAIYARIGRPFPFPKRKKHAMYLFVGPELLRIRETASLWGWIPRFTLTLFSYIFQSALHYVKMLNISWNESLWNRRIIWRVLWLQDIGYSFLEWEQLRDILFQSTINIF